MDVAPLSGGIGQHLGEGFFEPRVIVGDDELDAAKTPVLQAYKEVFPGRPTLARGEIDAQNLPASALIDTDRDQDRLGPDDTPFTDLLVTGIENQVGIRLFQTPLGKGREGLIEPLVEDADAEGRETLAQRAPR